MRKLLLASVLALLLAAAATPALAGTQPSNGRASEGRNARGFGGGPHCHINVVATENQHVFDFIAVYPSHTAHVHTGLPQGVFVADPNCDGDPGQ
ncbi:hypothetical protein HRbin24_01357 [bacterium HR24]|jgi:hypothetical protein|nr:hypothetical protein HRbin24_01357 [bacterium HR24]